MNFVEAMAAIKTDKTTIRRRTWSEQSYLKIYSSKRANDYFECNGMGEYKTDSIIFLFDGENAEVWIPLAEDIYADDWEIYVEAINENKQIKEKEE
ncbi:Thoeris anti-defense Tad2 family protein [Anaerostipes sp. Marseille-Q3525]|uniref:Thoeris anti-defense Tad2 family protein n=1 Tax=Anaerostipes sp. Marseille-Q3525 TaxID=2758418 RepID=UPI001BA726A5|nr:MW1434 family type I TA system toxin [Anaerostipes sp. Marseille-Q3525]MBR9961896.1 DUF2829 domain-containing protein [Anaerostipes sp. Marseille-Q3525]